MHIPEAKIPVLISGGERTVDISVAVMTNADSSANLMNRQVSYKCHTKCNLTAPFILKMKLNTML